MRLTRRQVEALAHLLDGLEHGTAPSTTPSPHAPALTLIATRTVGSLAARGLARPTTGRDKVVTYRITPAGREAYAAEKRRG